MQTTLRFATTTEMFTAPAGYTLEQAVRWLARLHTPGNERRVKQIGNKFFCDNGRRGVNRRSCVIETV